MRYWTWAEIKAKIESECDLQDETFVRPDELLAYANEAIDEAESEIHSLYEDYFLKYKDYNVQDQVETISMPDDIYANKIRSVIFHLGTQIGQNMTSYRVKRLSDARKFEQKAIMDSYNPKGLYEYFVVNSTVGSPQIMFTPKVWQTGIMRVWYLRNANRLYTDTDICDIPEFVNFVIAFIKVKVYAKESHQDLPDAEATLERLRASMNGTLQAMVPDADNNIDMDLSYYDEMN